MIRDIVCVIVLVRLVSMLHIIITVSLSSVFHNFCLPAWCIQLKCPNIMCFMNYWHKYTLKTRKSQKLASFERILYTVCINTCCIHCITAVSLCSVFFLLKVAWKWNIGSHRIWFSGLVLKMKCTWSLQHCFSSPALYTEYKTARQSQIKYKLSVITTCCLTLIPLQTLSLYLCVSLSLLFKTEG